jgi:sugar phosphate isomerase/epimerase
MARTAINLYSVRELDEPMARTLERVADAGYDGVQFSGGFRDATPSEVATTVEELGLAVTPAHVAIDELESDLDGVIESYGHVGAAGAVVPYLDEEHFASTDAATETAARLDAIAQTLADHDFSVHYHNHAHEFVDLDGTTGFEVFADASSVGLEVDVGWVHTGGHDPAALIDRYADRVDVVHMKDMADGEFRELGEGAVDLEAVAAAARDAEASWFVYEHDEPSDPTASIDRGATVLESL